jgi:ubiquinone/menaquinone biosynthesis C-methylase UbiE
MIRPVNTTYEPFSKEPEYVEANRLFVAEQDLRSVRRFLDLACGTGLISGLLLEANPRASLHGIDCDPVQIELAEEHLRGLGHPVRRGFDLSPAEVGGRPVVTFGACSADELPFPDGAFDCVTICNAIHMLPDKRKLLAEVTRVLQPGGLFGFNTSFYAGTYAQGTEEHFYLWVAEADRYIRRLNEQRLAAGQEKIKRVRGHRRGAFQNRWHSEQEWTQLLAEVGLRTCRRNVRVVPLNERCLTAIAAYGGFAEVLLSGYPVDVASTALQATAGRSLELAGLATLPRNYLESWSIKE